MRGQSRNSQANNYATAEPPATADKPGSQHGSHGAGPFSTAGSQAAHNSVRSRGSGASRSFKSPLFQMNQYPPSIMRRITRDADSTNDSGRTSPLKQPHYRNAKEVDMSHTYGMLAPGEADRTEPLMVRPGQKTTFNHTPDRIWVQANATAPTTFGLPVSTTSYGRDEPQFPDDTRNANVQ